MAMASSGDLRSLLGPATFSQIPSNAQVVLQQAWVTHTNTLKTQLEKVKSELSAVSGERDDLSRQVFTARAEREDMASLAERRQADLTSLTEDVVRAETAKVKISSQFLVQPSLCPLITCILIRLEG